VTRWQRNAPKRAQYPAGWKAIARATRERAGNVCQMPGCGARHRWIHPVTGSIVFLQASHRDHNRADCSPGNLWALCQCCHLRYDAPLHAQQRYMARREGKAMRDMWEL
jgi:hypothetical protein